MTAIAHDNLAVFYWGLTVAGTPPTYAPTVANITASTRLVGVTAFSLPSSESEVDTSDIDGLYDTAVVGRSKAGPITLTLKRDDTTETAGWDLFTFRQNGFVIYSPFGPAIVGKKVLVYPAQVGQKQPAGFAKNSVVTFDVNFYVRLEPNVDATVVA